MLKLFIFLMLRCIKINSNQSILPQNSNSYQCAERITENIKSHYILRMTSSWYQQNGVNYNHSYYISDNESINILNKNYTIDVYILKFKNGNDLFLWLKQVNHFKAWNSGGKFVIYVDEYNLKDEIMAILWKFYVINVIVILKNKDAYTYYPYNLINCQNDITAKYFFSCNDELPTEIFPQKVPNDFFGCPIKLLAFNYPPFVIDTSSNRDDSTKVGFEVAMMHAFTVKMNFKEEYVKYNLTNWGTRQPNGTFTDIFGLLQAGKIDCTFGQMVIDTSYKNSYDFDGILQGFMYYNFWYVPSANEKLRWSTLFRVFEPILWILITIFVIVTGFIWWIFNKINRDDIEITKKILIYIESSCKILLQAPVTLPTNTHIRIIIISWIMFCMLINTAYQSNLVSILRRPQMEHQISTFKELLESDLYFGTTSLMQTIMKAQPEHDIIWSKFILCPFNEKCLNRTAFKRDIAVIKTVINADYLSKKYYLNSKGKSMIFAIQDFRPLSFFPMFVVRRGYPLKDKLQAFILQLHSTGLVFKWCNDLVANEESEEIILSPLSVHDEFCAFIMLIFGLFVSSLAFITEIVVYKRKISISKL